jgi:hypothetical protein
VIGWNFQTVCKCRGHTKMTCKKSLLDPNNKVLSMGSDFIQTACKSEHFWPNGCWKEFLMTTPYFRIFCNCTSPLMRNWLIIWTTFNSFYYKDDLYQVWLKLVSCFLEDFPQYKHTCNKRPMDHIAHLSNFGQYRNVFISIWPIWPSGAMILINLLLCKIQLFWLHSS